MKKNINYRQHPYRGVFVIAATVLDVPGANAANRVSNWFRRGRKDVVEVVNGLTERIESKETTKIVALKNAVQEASI